MQEKDRFLEKINRLILVFIFCFCNNSWAEDINNKIFNYNNSLKNSSANFIQTNENYLQEGKIFFGDKRIKIDYNKPQKLTIILSEKKGMYTNHALKESEFFLTKKSYVKIFFDILNQKNYIKKMSTNNSNGQIEISEKTEIDNTSFNIKLVYENDPVKLRRLEIINKDEKILIGFFNHNAENFFDKSFFSMIDPYLN